MISILLNSDDKLVYKDEKNKSKGYEVIVRMFVNPHQEN